MTVGRCCLPSHRLLPLLVITLAFQMAIASESAPPGQADNSRLVPSQPTPLRSNPSVFRGGPSFDVEVLNVRAHDATMVALWAELAGQGFHVVAAVPQPDGTATLYLERTGGMRNEPPRLPGLIEQDAPAAAILRAKLQAAQADRQRSVVPAVPVGAMLPIDAKKP